MLGDMKPFKMAGNLYFVGTYKASSHLIATNEGHILIDTGYEQTADVIVESVKTLGFDIKDIKYIIHSHGHYDHTDGTAKLLKLTGAKTFLNFNDIKYIRGFKPDYDIKDGDIIELGGTKIYCMFTPGHTEGAVSFFFDVEENGKTYRAAMFGGAGTNQLKKDYLDNGNLSYLLRGQFFESIERLKKEKVDIFVGNHSWHNDTKGNYEKSLISKENPFIDDSRWGAFLDKCKSELENIIMAESREKFVTYAHRGASEYAPENTFMSFYLGMQMGANGIETDIHKTSDGLLVLFHDDTLKRVTDENGSIEDYTFEQLSQFNVKKNNLYDKIVSFEDFLEHFAFRDITFAIELKQAGVEKETADLIKKYNMEKKVVITSFEFENIKRIKQYAPNLRIGWLKIEITDEDILNLKEIGADEVCPKGENITAEKVEKWHREGFRVRAWGITDEEIMKKVYDIKADGMTVNFPDKLINYINKQI